VWLTLELRTALPEIDTGNRQSGNNVRIWADWGSSHLRIYLCRRNGHTFETLEERRGPGVKDCADFEAAFFELASDWLNANGEAPVYLSGMIGSTLGWHDAGYAPCPANLESVVERTFRFEARGTRFTIAPGLSGTSIFGLPDVMRGEEMQIFGCIAANAPRSDTQLFCLPGTHTKWASVERSTIVSFFTSLQGEMRELLMTYGLIGKTLGVDADRHDLDMSAFDAGVATMADPTLHIEHAVFSTRSRIVLGDLAVSQGASWLSGILIGAEVRDAVTAFRTRGHDAENLTLVGTPVLNKLYARALAPLGIQPTVLDGGAMAIAGMMALADAVESTEA
jgi:2-dehydro-3-deoxygalactonokinase